MGTKRIGILSDTHGWLNPKVFDFFKHCDEIWHAGDIGSTDIIDELNLIAPVKAVLGNCDDWDVRRITSEIMIFPCEEHKVMLKHIVGYPGKYDYSVPSIIGEERPTILVAGHSHILKVMQDQKNKLLFINPGAAGKYGIHTHITFIRFEISGSHISNMEIFDEVRNNKI